MAITHTTLPASLRELRDHFPHSAIVTAPIPPTRLVPGDFFWYARRAAALPVIEVVAPPRRVLLLPAECVRVLMPEPIPTAADSAERAAWRQILEAAE